MIKELQQLKATGTNTKNSRFGSALCSPGDINKDGALGKYSNLFMCGIVTKGVGAVRCNRGPSQMSMFASTYLHGTHFPKLHLQ
jgi:hypothetical protein